MEQLEVWGKRKTFFNNVLEHLMRDPIDIDFLLKQDKYYIKPKKDSLILNEKTGDWAIKVEGNFFNTPFVLWYSMWQVGNKLRVTMILEETNIMPAFVEDDHHEVNTFWGENQHPNIDTTHESLLYDWDFFNTNLYESYLTQEVYVLGIRHMHFRAMRIIYDFLEKQNNKNSEKEFVKVNL